MSDPTHRRELDAIPRSGEPPAQPEPLEGAEATVARKILSAQ